MRSAQLMMWTAPLRAFSLGPGSGRISAVIGKDHPIMRQIVRVGLDIAKRWFQVHAVDESEREIFNRKLSRDKVLGFLGSLPPCEVALEACSSSHHWGREIGRLG